MIAPVIENNARISRLAVLFAFILAAACSMVQANAANSELAVKQGTSGQTQSDAMLEDREPEAATGFYDKKSVVAKKFMVSSANKHASEAGVEILEQGGTAIDAAVAVQAMLSLVEPQSSGIGGGAFILYWDNEAKRLHTYDGREAAPANITSDVFFKDGKPMSWRDSVVGGKSVGVPGVLKALDMAHQHHGALPWSVLFDAPIALSTNGFEVSPRLAGLLARDLHPGLREFEESKKYFQPEGVWLQAGDIQHNTALASTLKKIAEHGADYFYTGVLAEKIAEAVRLAPTNPGKMSTSDLRNYNAIERLPMCGDYRKQSICGMPPPSSGGVSVFQILNALEQLDLKGFSPTSKEYVHAFAQASSLAFADRSVYLADLDFLGLSAKPLVADDYLSTRNALIDINEPYFKATPGNPYPEYAFAQDDAYELNSTSHISIVDEKGNAISMTTSIEFMFGSGLMVEGFLLNNQLTDFSISPEKDGKLVLNRVQPLKRPRSSMSPTMVFDENGELSLVVGSPGGSRIINYVAQALVNVIDFDMDIQQAISAPRFTNRNDYTALEKGRDISELEAALTSLNHNVRVQDLNSGLHGVQIKDGKLIGGADPRREGLAAGE